MGVKEFLRNFRAQVMALLEELSQITSGAAYRLPPSSLPVTEATTRPA
jgi:hypothetical protein